MTPEIRDRLLAQLIADEGVVLHAYKDSLGFWTIGCGRLIDKRRGGGITHMEALHLLNNDVDKVLAGLIASFSWFSELDDVRKMALCNMTFQLGLAGVKKFRNTLAAVARGDYAAAARGMRASLWARQTPKRALRVARLMETGSIDD